MRRTLHEGANFKIEFDTAGGGSYWAIYLGKEKGPFPSNEMALRHIKAKLETQPGQTMDEVTEAENRALREADKREAEGTLGSDAQRAAEAAARAEDEKEMRQLREEQGVKLKRRERVKLYMEQYELTSHQSAQVVAYEDQGVATADAVTMVRKEAEKNANPEGQ